MLHWRSQDRWYADISRQDNARWFGGIKPEKFRSGYNLSDVKYLIEQNLLGTTQRIDCPVSCSKPTVSAPIRAVHAVPALWCSGSPRMCLQTSGLACRMPPGRLWLVQGLAGSASGASSGNAARADDLPQVSIRPWCSSSKATTSSTGTPWL